MLTEKGKTQRTKSSSSKRLSNIKIITGLRRKFYCGLAVTRDCAVLKINYGKVFSLFYPS